MELPDPNDRHVLAAALRGRADVIVTENVRDFPPALLEPFGIEAVRLDEFLMTQFHLNRAAAARIIGEQMSAMGRPPVTIYQLLNRLAASGAPRFAQAVSREVATSRE